MCAYVWGGCFLGSFPTKSNMGHSTFWNSYEFIREQLSHFPLGFHSCYTDWTEYCPYIYSPFFFLCIGLIKSFWGLVFLYLTCISCLNINDTLYSSVVSILWGCFISILCWHLKYVCNWNLHETPSAISPRIQKTLIPRSLHVSSLCSNTSPMYFLQMAMWWWVAVKRGTQSAEEVGLNNCARRTRDWNALKWTCCSILVHCWSTAVTSSSSLSTPRLSLLHNVKGKVSALKYLIFSLSSLNLPSHLYHAKSRQSIVAPNFWSLHAAPLSQPASSHFLLSRLLL